MSSIRLEHTPFRAGACVGLFIGTLLGLSGSPILATFLGVVSSLGAAVLASRSKEVELSGTIPRAATAAAFVAGFGLVGTVALLAGVYLRSHGSLGPSPQEVRDRWVRLGVSPEEATQIAVRQWASTGPSGPGPDGRSPLAPYLFASRGDAVMELDPSGRGFDAVRSQWRQAGGVWSNLMTQADSWVQFDDAQKSKALTTYWKALLQSQ